MTLLRKGCFKIGYWLYSNTVVGKWVVNSLQAKVEKEHPLGHSAQMVLEYDNVHVCIIPYLADNYGYIIWRDRCKKCIVVDPGFFPPFSEFILLNGLTLDTVLITHKHYDHCGAANAIKVLYPNVKIYSHRRDGIKASNVQIENKIYAVKVCENEIGEGIEFTAYHTPGHTTGHVIYSIKTDYLSPSYTDGSLLLFTGDCIFIGSIGAIFEGNDEDHLKTLHSFIEEILLLNIPINKIYLFPGHEYSLTSLQFIISNCSPFSSLARKKLSWVEEQRNWSLPTVPASLFEELSYSPFLRIAIASLPNNSRMSFIKSENNQIVKYYLPNIVEVMQELCLSENFLRAQAKKKDKLNFDTLRLKLLQDLSCCKNKITLRCEFCFPEPFVMSLNGSTTENVCVAKRST